MGKQIGAGLLPELVAPAVVVGMGVGHHRRVHPVERDVRLPQPVDEGRPGLLPGKAGIHEHSSVAVDERVAIDMAEARHAHRQLKPQHSGRHLGHV